MQMIPSHPYATRSRAELRVFDQLRRAFSTGDRSGWFALHSLNVPRHEYKRFGEIDFVVCGPQALLVLEVKGGGVSCHSGIWQTTNRDGETERLKGSPFRQAETALHGLCKKLPRSLVAQFAIGYGVVTPDCNLAGTTSAEWDQATLADAKDFRQFEHWLGKLIGHWHRKDPKRDASPEALRELKQALRPDFEVAVPLYSQVHAIEDQIAHMTESQLRLIDIVDANPRVMCEGGAGTGKTLLALELARRWTASNQRVALACYSPWLKDYLDRMQIRGLTVCLADAISLAARRAGVEKFDALIVDEGQDLLSMDRLGKLDRALVGGLAEGRWCFFHDVNNQLGLCGDYSPDAYAYLTGLAPASVPLRTNCRNSLQILRRLQESLGADVGTAGVGEGPEVIKIATNSQSDAAQALARELARLTDQVGFAPSEIVVLSPAPFPQSCAACLPPNMRDKLQVLDAFTPRGTSNSKIGFAKIANYKGLESAAVILVDLPPPRRDSDHREQHYVGMSRARAVLVIISIGSSAKSVGEKVVDGALGDRGTGLQGERIKEYSGPAFEQMKSATIHLSGRRPKCRSSLSSTITQRHSGAARGWRAAPGIQLLAYRLIGARFRVPSPIEPAMVPE